MGRMRQTILVILIGASLTGAYMVFPAVDKTRTRLGRSSIAESEKKSPAITLLQHLLGGFRGLLVDAVWLRAVTLQQNKQYWELNQLCDWMGKLEPHVEDIWVFNAWNMAYNLVAEHPNSEARWQWIWRALDLLRNQGLKYNPKSGLIMKEIAWIFHNKIGRNLDIHHFYYKNRWATTMHVVMGEWTLQDVPHLWFELKYTMLRDMLARASEEFGLSHVLLKKIEKDAKIRGQDSPEQLDQIVRRTLRKPDDSLTLEAFFSEAFRISGVADVLGIYFLDGLQDAGLVPAFEELFQVPEGKDAKVKREEIFWELLDNPQIRRSLEYHFQKMCKMVEAEDDTIRLDFRELLKASDVKSALEGDFKLDPPEKDIEALLTVRGIYEIPERVLKVLLRQRDGVVIRQKLFNFVVARVLYTEFKMRRLDVMLAIERKLGRFDWRLPEPHAMYWVENAALVDMNFREHIHYDRLALHSVQETMRRGILAYFDPNKPYNPPVTLQDLTKIPRLQKLYMDMIEKYGENAEHDLPGSRTFKDGHMQFLQEVSFQLFFTGREALALRYYTELNKKYDKPRPRIPIEDYCLGKVTKFVNEYATQSKMESFIDGLIWQWAYNVCTNRRMEAANTINLAKRAWRAYRSYDQSAAQGKLEGKSAPGSGVRKYGALATFDEIFRKCLQAIIDEKIPFSKQLMPALQYHTGLKKTPEKEFKPMAPPEPELRPPSSPPDEK